MEIIHTTISIENTTVFKNKMLNWATQFNIFCFLDNNEYNFEKPSFECVLAAGCKRSITLEPGTAYQSLQHFYNENPGWLFGHLGYELKNEIEKITSTTNPLIDFGLSFFFEPAFVIQVKDGSFSIVSDTLSAADIFADINSQPGEIINTRSSRINIKNSIDKKAYIDAVIKLKEHIKRGDCYEINFCQHFFAEDVALDPLYMYASLTEISPTPFASLYKLNDKYCLCASPERYLQRKGNTIISQPIKGTKKRSRENKQEDEINKKILENSEKDKSENVMVVDLVRNDLSKVCIEGSVKVDELFGIYTFPQVYQMISTISGTLKENISFVDIIKATFPMGSMTGAPKKRVMELIDEYETVGRGLFSGSIGYIKPGGNFDFNVVIRSIFYDEHKKLLSFLAGGGITFYSNAEDEYEESMLKAEAIIKLLNNNAIAR